MQRIVFDRPMRFSPDGHTVVAYPASAEPVEVSDRCAEVAIGARYAHPHGEPAPVQHTTKPRSRAKGKG